MRNKKELGVVGGVIVLIIVVVLLAKHQDKVMMQNAGQTSSTQTGGNESGASPSSSSATSGSQGTKKLSYADAIKKYPNRIQFVNCSGNPGTVSVKRNTPVMLDNRDKKAHTIRGAGQSFRIAALDYAVMYPQNEGTFQLTCDGGGTSIVNVEK